MHPSRIHCRLEVVSDEYCGLEILCAVNIFKKFGMAPLVLSNIEVCVQRVKKMEEKKKDGVGWNRMQDLPF